MDAVGLLLNSRFTKPAIKNIALESIEPGNISDDELLGAWLILFRNTSRFEPFYRSITDELQRRIADGELCFFNRTFCGYEPIIRDLLASNARTLETATCTLTQKSPRQHIVCIGDSHSLSIAQSLRLRGADCVSHLSPGCKIWHLKDAKQQDLKTIFEESRVRKSQSLLFSFGEIDCREDEGILKYHRKSGTSIKIIVKNTMQHYLYFMDTIEDLIQKWQKIIILPVINKEVCASDSCEPHLSARAQVTIEVNRQLKKMCIDRNYDLAELVYNSDDFIEDGIHISVSSWMRILRKTIPDSALRSK